MSQIGGVTVRRHRASGLGDVLTIRPSEFKPRLQRRNGEKNAKKALPAIPLPGGRVSDRLDKAVENYNEIYYKPARKLIDELYEKNLLSRDKALDEKLEIDMYELWHHEGRRARFGAAMMAPDYAWWHGFYELKKRCMEIEAQAEELKRTGKPATVHEVKGATGDTTKPALP